MTDYPLRPMTLIDKRAKLAELLGIAVPRAWGEASINIALWQCTPHDQFALGQYIAGDVGATQARTYWRGKAAKLNEAEARK